MNWRTLSGAGPFIIIGNPSSRCMELGSRNIMQWIGGNMYKRSICRQPTARAMRLKDWKTERPVRCRSLHTTFPRPILTIKNDRETLYLKFRKLSYCRLLLLRSWIPSIRWEAQRNHPGVATKHWDNNRCGGSPRRSSDFPRYFSPQNWKTTCKKEIWLGHLSRGDKVSLRRSSTTPHNRCVFVSCTDFQLCASDLGHGRASDDIFYALKKTWSAALSSGAKVLALTIPECAAKVISLDTRRNELNRLILSHTEDRLWVIIHHKISAAPVNVILVSLLTCTPRFRTTRPLKNSRRRFSTMAFILPQRDMIWWVRWLGVTWRTYFSLGAPRVLQDVIFFNWSRLVEKYRSMLRKRGWWWLVSRFQGHSRRPWK